MARAESRLAIAFGLVKIPTVKPIKQIKEINLEDHTDSIDIVAKKRCDFKAIMNGVKILSRNTIKKYCNWKAIVDIFCIPFGITLGVILFLMSFQVMYWIGIAKNYLLGTHDFSKLPWCIFGDENKKYDGAMGLAFMDGFCIVAITVTVVLSIIYGKKLICHLCELGQEKA